MMRAVEERCYTNLYWITRLLINVENTANIAPSLKMRRKLPSEPSCPFPYDFLWFQCFGFCLCSGLLCPFRLPAPGGTRVALSLCPNKNHRPSRASKFLKLSFSAFSFWTEMQSLKVGGIATPTSQMGNLRAGQHRLCLLDKWIWIWSSDLGWSSLRPPASSPGEDACHLQGTPSLPCLQCLPLEALPP